MPPKWTPKKWFFASESAVCLHFLTFLFLITTTLQGPQKQGITVFLIHSVWSGGPLKVLLHKNGPPENCTIAPPKQGAMAITLHMGDDPWGIM